MRLVLFWGKWDFGQNGVIIKLLVFENGDTI
jgi:hypothetical protein